MAKKRLFPKNRAGSYIAQPGAFRAFVPKPLPPEPPITMGPELIHLLSLADRAIGRLDASTDNLPNPDFFVYMYVMQEAALSSQIEGTQATFNDALELQANPPATKKPSDVDEIFNYVDAMNYGLDRLKKQEPPLCLRLIREIHERLLKGVRGQNRDPGQFRKNHNYIGPKGCTRETATFVPPSPDQMNNALNDMESFMQEQSFIPPLVRAALLHAQFETIHPFLNGNGRIGRLLITLFLCDQKILRRPLLYLSNFFKHNHLDYYAQLQAIRDTGDWESWIKFFLQGVHSVALEATETARKIVELRESHRNLVQQKLRTRTNKALKLLDRLYEAPYVSSKNVTEILNVTPATANSLIRKFIEIGILSPKDEKKRKRTFRYYEYLDLFDKRENKIN